MLFRSPDPDAPEKLPTFTMPSDPLFDQKCPLMPGYNIVFPLIGGICWHSKESNGVITNNYAIITGGITKKLRPRYENDPKFKLVLDTDSLGAVLIYDPQTNKVFRARGKYDSFLRDVQWRPLVTNSTATFKERFALTVVSFRR